MTKRLMTLSGTTLPFVNYENEGLEIFEFDASRSECPEPMVNAMRGLQLIDSAEKRLVMINMHEPEGLYPRIAGDFLWDVEALENGDVKITFRRKGTDALQTDFSDTECSGL